MEVSAANMSRKSVRALAILLLFPAALSLPLHDAGSHLALAGKTASHLRTLHVSHRPTGSTLSLRGGNFATAQSAGGSKETGKSIFWPVLTCFLYFTSVSVTLPAVPSMANKIANADGSAKVSPEGVSLKGTFSSIDLAFTMLTTKLWGTISDRYGRKPMMLLSTAGLSLGWLTIVQGCATKDLQLLYAGRALDGITSCMQPICQSAIKDVSLPEKMQGNFGLLQGAALGGSLIVGGIVGGVLTKRKGPEFVILVAAGIAAVNIVATALFAPETLDETRRATSVNWKEANPLGALTALTRDWVTRTATCIMLLSLTALNGLQTNFFSYVEHRYAWDRQKASILLTLVGVVMAASQFLGSKVLSPLIGTGRTIQLGIALQGLASLTMALTTSPKVFSAAVLTFSAGCLCFPLLTSVVASRATFQECGAVLSALDTASMLQKVLTHKGMAWLFALGMRHELPGSFFFAGAGCSAVALVLFQLIHKEASATAQKKDPSQQA